ncbi:hypothetical protein [Psychromarinibacter halotolerans]|uniref:Uncharacterized protein n=1 Tax=Psychromarinibacter halotolerans TaxID=1775175 RepID=A0ABV7GUD5_9RHOB|nr:hypothetical protein [Psychromarinibacter halotolerans]MDF0594901.1 hypothetical protein [Psychromarinibacter halotolerans]
MKLAGIALVGAIVLVFAAVLLRSPPDGPDAPRVALVARCDWTAYCRAGDCDTTPLPAFRILRNGDYGRTYLGFDGDEGMPQVSVALSDDGTRQMSLSAGTDADGVETFHVWTLHPDGSFDYRLSARLISNPAIDTGAGQCGPFEESEAA